MDMMNAVAAQVMGAASDRYALQYSMSLQKMAMNSQEQAAQELLEMLPQKPPSPYNIDVYA